MRERNDAVLLRKRLWEGELQLRLAAQQEKQERRCRHFGEIGKERFCVRILRHGAADHDAALRKKRERIAREHERVCLRGFKRIHIERARGLLHRGEHGGDCAVLDVLFLAMQQVCAGKAVFFDQIEKCVAIHIRIIAQIKAGWERKTRLQRGKRMRLQGSPKR